MSSEKLSAVPVRQGFVWVRVLAQCSSLGGGIIPTLQCSDLLLSHLDDLDGYCSEVLRQFSFYGTAYNFLEPLLRGEINLLDHPSLSLAVLMHMRANETRYGFRMGYQAFNRASLIH